jgi:hypothetical protein
MDPMDATKKTVRPDIVLAESAPRPTPAPSRVAFADVLAAGAGSLANGAQVALSAITTPVGLGGLGTGSTGTSGSDPSGGVNSALQQSANLNMYYLQLQMQVDGQNRAYTAQSNILKAEHDGAKNAIGNIHS